MKKRAILIDPETRTITKVEIEDSIEDWTKTLQCEYFEMLPYPYIGTVMLVDEEARITRPNAAAFLIRQGFNTPTSAKIRIIGRALIISQTLRGKLAHVRPSIDDVASIVSWTTPAQN